MLVNRYGKHAPLTPCTLSAPMACICRHADFADVVYDAVDALSVIPIVHPVYIRNISGIAKHAITTRKCNK